MLNINTIIKMGFVDRLHVQCTLIFHERCVQEEEEEKRHTLLISRFNDMYFIRHTLYVEDNFVFKQCPVENSNQRCFEK